MTFVEEQITEIQQDRRSRRRYTIELPLRYEVISDRNAIRFGTGHTLNLSSSGIAFVASGAIEVGNRLRLSIKWPVLLDGRCPLQLCVTGTVVRDGNAKSAITMESYEFRTQALCPDLAIVRKRRTLGFAGDLAVPPDVRRSRNRLKG